MEGEREREKEREGWRERKRERIHVCHQQSTIIMTKARPGLRRFI